MKLENNWQYKTLENLEKDRRPDGDFETFLLRRCRELRKIPLNNFAIEDLRIMIGQQIGLNYLIPPALEVLAEDLFAEGDFYEGDLLQNVLKADAAFWMQNKQYWQKLHDLIVNQLDELRENKLDAAAESFFQLFKS